MAWNDDPKHPFAGIAERLKRADQNMINLESEVNLFMQSGEYPVIPHPDTEEWKKAILYHKDKPIPLRFAVLVGEIVHHLRSCFDHIIWHFSDAESRTKPGGLEFPVFKTEPTEKKEIELYARKIKGVSNADVLTLIREMQPYGAGANVANHLLLVIHDMDRFDKHRELVIVDSGLQVFFPMDNVELRRKADLYSQGKLPESEHLILGRAIKDYQAAPSISFREFGNHRPYAVIKGLAELCVATRDAVDRFADFV